MCRNSAGLCCEGCGAASVRVCTWQLFSPRKAMPWTQPPQHWAAWPFPIVCRPARSFLQAPTEILGVRVAGYISYTNEQDGCVHIIVPYLVGNAECLLMPFPEFPISSQSRSVRVGDLTRVLNRNPAPQMPERWGPLPDGRLG